MADSSAIVVVEEGEDSVVVGVENTSAIVISPEILQAIVVSIPGIPGPRGATGPIGDSPQIEAAMPLSGNRVIASNAAGLGIYADQNESSALMVVGVSTGAAAAGDMITLQRNDVMEWPSAGLTAGLPLYLGSTGLLTQIVPTTGWLRQIAVAVDSDRIVIEIGTAYFLGV